VENYSDTGFILACSPLQERDMLMDILCYERGRVRAVVKYGATSKQRPLLQPANYVQIQATARLASHMPRMEVELLTPYFALMMRDGLLLSAAQSAHHLCMAFLPEQHPYKTLFLSLHHMYDALQRDPLTILKHYVHFELCLLQECGYGLQLTRCVVTGDSHDLAYISPKSGEAVGRAAGVAYKDRLFTYPHFLLDETLLPTWYEIDEALHMTGHFIHQRMGDGRSHPWMEARCRFIGQIEHKKENKYELFCE
jgi:DNA repair protein RecO (recombination protein O)